MVWCGRLSGEARSYFTIIFFNLVCCVCATLFGGASPSPLLPSRQGEGGERGRVGRYIFLSFTHLLGIFLLYMEKWFFFYVIS